MAKNLAEATAAEEAAIKAYEQLMAAKTKEVEALQVAIEAKLKLIGELGMAIVQMKEDLSDTEAALLEDKKFFAALKTDCATKSSEWEERSKTRSEELLAIAETIKILNDDDALELFKKTLPSASSSFVELRARVEAGASTARARALAVLRESWRTVRLGQRSALDLLLLAINGRQARNAGGFEKIIKMIDDMVVLLKKEQTDDDHKKEYCATQLDLADDKKKAVEHSLEATENAISSAEEGLETLKEEIASLEASIVALDKSVMEATAQRKSENKEYK